MSIYTYSKNLDNPALLVLKLMNDSIELGQVSGFEYDPSSSALRLQYDRTLSIAEEQGLAAWIAGFSNLSAQQAELSIKAEVEKAETSNLVNKITKSQINVGGAIDTLEVNTLLVVGGGGNGTQISNSSPSNMYTQSLTAQNISTCNLTGLTGKIRGDFITRDASILQSQVRHSSTFSNQYTSVLSYERAHNFPISSLIMNVSGIDDFGVRLYNVSKNRVTVEAGFSNVMASRIMLTCSNESLDNVYLGDIMELHIKGPYVVVDRVALRYQIV